MPEGDASPSNDDDWLTVGSAEDIPEGRPVLIDVEGLGLFLYRTADAVYALSNTCTHQGGPLHRGVIGSVGKDPTIACPFHGSVFRLTDGRVIRGPATRPQPVFDARIAEGSLQIRDRG